MFLQHTYITYGPLLCGATQVLWEGVPAFPKPDRIWQIVEKHKVETTRFASNFPYRFV